MHVVLIGGPHDGQIADVSVSDQYVVKAAPAIARPSVGMTPDDIFPTDAAMRRLVKAMVSYHRYYINPQRLIAEYEGETDGASGPLKKTH